MGFWKNVKAECRYEDVSYKELSAISGVPYSTIINGMNRDNEPSALTAIAVCKALGLSVESMLTEDIEFAKCCEGLSNRAEKELALYRKYKRVIANLESLNSKVRDSLIHMIACMNETSNLSSYILDDRGVNRT